MNRKTRKAISNAIVVIVVLITFIGVCTHFFHFGKVEYTDNAQVRQHIVPVNSRVQGFIKKVYFDEYQQVRKGDTLAVIEDAEFVLRVAQAEADYQNAITGKHVMTTGVSTTRNNVAVSAAGLQEAKVLLDNAERDYLRYLNLFAQKAVTRQRMIVWKLLTWQLKPGMNCCLCQKKSASLVTVGTVSTFGTNGRMGIKVAEAALASCPD